jgi:GTP cyclohydrolase IA
LDENTIRNLIVGMGDNPDRDGVRDTPNRVIRAFHELFAGYTMKPKDILARTFDSKHQELVIVQNIEFYSFCEHHLLPFYGQVDIGYIPKKRVLGVSKFARLVDCFARRLQIQEEMTTQIADSIMEYLEPLGCIVEVRGKHLCMMMRGVQKQNSEMLTSAVRGCFSCNEQNCRDEFLSLVNRGKK